VIAYGKIKNKKGNKIMILITLMAMIRLGGGGQTEPTKPILPL